jgi:phosphate starvation-inducible protein PhoH
MKKQISKKIDQNLTIDNIVPKTDNQVRVFDSNKHCVLHGAAGTGKSFISSYIGYKAVLRQQFASLVYIRSTVPVRKEGFLPGNAIEKAAEYERPYIEIATELFNRGDAYETLKRSEAVKFCSTAYLRGINLNNVFIIVDECQNMTFQELDTVMTRIGKDSRIFFCGDYYQRDEPQTGIKEFYNVLKSMNEFDFIDFTIDDVVRSDLVKSYLKAKYEKGNFIQSNLSDSRTGISKFLAGRTDIQNSDLQQSSNADGYSELQPDKEGSSNNSNRSDGSDSE